MSEVYFIDSGNAIKVGYSADVARRLSGLQTGSPVRLELLGSIPGGAGLERAIHARLADFRTHNEWFLATSTVRAAIRDLLARGPDSINYVPTPVRPPRVDMELCGKVLNSAVLFWPRKTAEKVAKITGASERSAYRWLSQKTVPPASAILALLGAIKAEHAERGKMFEQFDFTF